jgi:hypothetical protein
VTTLAEFVTRWNGKYLDFDRKFGPQCVDPIDQYVVDVLGIPIVWVVGAVDWYGKDAAYLHWTPNRWGDRNSKPSRGSIVVWGQNVRAGTGVYGHIALCTDPGDGITFGAFSQNYPTNSPCALRRFAYDGVIGWGDKPAPPPPPPADPCAGLRADLAASLAIRQQQADQMHAYREAVAAWAAGVPK